MEAFPTPLLLGLLGLMLAVTLVSVVRMLRTRKENDERLARLAQREAQLRDAIESFPEGIAVWDGDFYATGLIERLGFADSGGIVRIGLTHYNTAAEVDRLLEVLGRIATRGEA